MVYYGSLYTSCCHLRCSSDVFSVFCTYCFTICHPTCYSANHSTFSHNLVGPDYQCMYKLDESWLSKYMRIWTAKKWNCKPCSYRSRLCYCPTMALEAYTQDIHVTLLLKILATGLPSICASASAMYHIYYLPSLYFMWVRSFSFHLQWLQLDSIQQLTPC